ncbi:signal peptidase II [Qiania dongpingensis]|uniref:Lipoprotein signal peptidase n=1 Tax=Qiania dongpingensis TaxID=2763669 RepID=A0A7G9G4T0_9FIRM|nr:signal peptidase II [Qiania dongpingensis]QNM05812.1 signal peptidase II [Qiania dongpingensis]
MEANQTKKRFFTVFCYLLGAVLLVGFDQWTKSLAVAHLKGQEAYPIIKGVFELSYLENRGMAWGLLSGQRYIFLAGSVLILFLIAYAFWRAPSTKRYLPARLVLTVLFAGAIGNLVDRLAQGYVVDFFSFTLINFPVFNVADCYVVAAGIAFVIFFLFYYKDEELAVFLPGKGKKKSTPDKKSGEDAQI